MAAADALAALGEAQVGALVAALHDPYSATLSIHLAELLTTMGSSGRDALISLCHDSLAGSYARQALAQLDDPKAEATLAELERERALRESEPYSRAATGISWGLIVVMMILGTVMAIWIWPESRWAGIFVMVVGVGPLIGLEVKISQRTQTMPGRAGLNARVLPLALLLSPFGILACVEGSAGLGVTLLACSALGVSFVAHFYLRGRGKTLR